MIEFLTRTELFVDADSRISIRWFTPTNFTIVAFGGRVSIVMGHAESSPPSETSSSKLHLFSIEASQIDHNSIVRFYPNYKDPNTYTEYDNAEVVENLFAAMQDLMKLKPVK